MKYYWHILKRKGKNSNGGVLAGPGVYALGLIRYM